MVLRIKNKTDFGVILGGARFSFSGSLLIRINNKLYSFPCSGASFAIIVLSPGKNVREITNLGSFLTAILANTCAEKCREKGRKKRTH